jgi:hypothetical protein
MSEVDPIPFCIDLGPSDHVFHFVYNSLLLPEPTSKPRYGLTVRASCLPIHLQLRSAVKMSDRDLPVLGYEPHILIASARKPTVDWSSQWTWRGIEALLREADVRNESRDTIWLRRAIRVEGLSTEIGQKHPYNVRSDIPLPRGFQAKTLVHSATRITIL